MQQGNHSGTEIADDPGRDEAELWEDAAVSPSDGDRNAFSLGEPTVDGAGT
jgi:hypothetical protein